MVFVTISAGLCRNLAGILWTKRSIDAGPLRLQYLFTAARPIYLTYSKEAELQLKIKPFCQ